jgi:hypothetical protein
VGLQSGCFSPTMMTAVHVGLRSRPRASRDWSASGSGLFVGLRCAGYAAPPSGRPWVRSDRAPGAWLRGSCDWANLVASGGRGSRGVVCIEVQVAYDRAGCHASSGGLSGWGVQTKPPGRKFQSHPGVPPARLIECASCWLWGERSFHASWRGLLASSPLSSSLGRCWAAVRRACTMSRSWHAGAGLIIFVCFSRQSLIRQGLAWRQ